MNISGFQYNLNHKALEIYVSGCTGECVGCHNTELWDFSIGKDYRDFFLKIENKIKTGLVDIVWVLGGDPLDQNPVDLIQLLKFIKTFNVKLFLWTRYMIDDLPNGILNYLDYIKTGKFIPDNSSYIEPVFNIKLASSNQKIIKVK